MNVWLVNPFDNLPQEGTRPQRYWLMAEAFVRAGHQVAYWTSDFSHATKKRRVARVQTGGAIEVVEIATLPYAKNVCWTRVRSHRKLARDFESSARARVSGLSPKPDLVIASVPPLGLCSAALRVARSCGARFVCDVQDAWPETFERLVPRFVWALLGLRRLAKRLYCEADGVSAVAQRYLDLARARGCVVPMHLAGHAISLGPCERIAHNDGVLRLAYVGNMSLSYDLETVIRAMRDLPGVSLDIAGNGPDFDRLKALAEDSSNESAIRFHGYLNEADLSALLRRCDVGLVPMFPESCVGVPGKLADYAAAGLRVIESLGGECRDLVSAQRAGVSSRAGDVASFRSAVRELQNVMKTTPFDARRWARTFDATVIMDEYVRWVLREVK